MRTVIKICLLLSLIPLPISPVVAQEDGRQPHPALAAVQWGAEYFAFPEWQVTLVTNETQVSSVWQNSGELPAIVSYLWQLVSETFSPTEISELVNDDWLDTVLEGYDSWEEVERCIVDDIIIVEINTAFEEIPYAARYWVRGNSDAVTTIFVAFPANQPLEMEDLAAHFFGNAAGCG